MQPKFPKWLPSSVVKTASSIYPDLDISMRLRLLRLTTDSEMEFVWRRLDRETRAPPLNARVHPNRITEFGDAFLGGYLRVAMWADSEADYWKNAPRAEAQNATMRQIRDTAQLLIRLLGDPLSPITLTPLGEPLVHRQFTPWDRLDAAVVSARNGPEAIQTLLNKLAGNTEGRYWTQPEIGAAYAFDNLPARALLGDLPPQLAGVVALAELSMSSDSAASKPPNKTEHLVSTIYARKLAQYAKSSGLRARSLGHVRGPVQRDLKVLRRLQELRGLADVQSKPQANRQAGFPLHQIIAITTNVALNLSVINKIRPDKIRRLIA